MQDALARLPHAETHAGPLQGGHRHEHHAGGPDRLGRSTRGGSAPENLRHAAGRGQKELSPDETRMVKARWTQPRSAYRQQRV